MLLKSMVKEIQNRTYLNRFIDFCFELVLHEPIIHYFLKLCVSSYINTKVDIDKQVYPQKQETMENRLVFMCSIFTFSIKFYFMNKIFG